MGPISSTNTNRLLSSLPNVKRHTNLSHSSRSLAPADLFSTVPVLHKNPRIKGGGESVMGRYEKGTPPPLLSLPLIGVGGGMLPRRLSDKTKGGGGGKKIV